MIGKLISETDPHGQNNVRVLFSIFGYSIYFLTIKNPTRDGFCFYTRDNTSNFILWGSINIKSISGNYSKPYFNYFETYKREYIRINHVYGKCYCVGFTKNRALEVKVKFIENNKNGI